MCQPKHRGPVIGHIFSFEVWKKSPETKHLIETVTILVIGALMVLYANEYLDEAKEAKIIHDEILLIEAGSATGDLEALYDQLQVESELFHEDTVILLALNMLTIGYFVKNICEIVYSNARNSKIDVLSIEIIMNAIATVVVIVW